MKFFLMTALLFCPLSWSQDMTPDQQRALLQEVQTLKERVNELEKKDAGSGFKSTDYHSKTTENTGAPAGPAMTDEQRKELMETMEKYKKAQIEQEKALKELENEE
jgi:hypothetical protein